MRATSCALTLLLAVGLAGCGGGGGGSPPASPLPDPMPDFHLTDVNPASATAGADVSPRDYLGEVSAWYFGHST